MDEVEELIAKLKDLDADVADSAAWDLEKMGKKAVPALIEALKDRDEDVRWRAANILEYIGEPAVPALIEALKDGNVEVRRNAVWTLGLIKDPRAIPALIGTLNDEEDEVQWKAAEVLEEMGKEAVPALIDALNDKNLTVRYDAAKVLENIGLANLDPGELVVYLLYWGEAEDLVKLFPEDTLSNIRSTLKEFIEKRKWDENKSNVMKKRFSKAYARIAKAISERKEADTPGEMLEGKIKPPKKPGIYRMKRAVNG